MKYNCDVTTSYIPIYINKEYNQPKIKEPKQQPYESESCNDANENIKNSDISKENNKEISEHDEILKKCNVIMYSLKHSNFQKVLQIRRTLDNVFNQH